MVQARIPPLESSLRAVSPFQLDFSDGSWRMGRLKKVASETAGVAEKFEQKQPVAGSKHRLAGWKARVPALLWAPDRLARGADCLPSLGRFVRKFEPTPLQN